MKKIFKILIGHWLEIFVGMIVFFGIDDIRWSLLYLLIVLLLVMELIADYLRALVRTTHIANECKITAITRAMKITEDEIEKIGNEFDDKLTKEQRDDLIKDFNRVGLK